MICLQDMPYFDKKYVAFGQVVLGMDVLDIINKVSCTFDVPDLAIKISLVEKVDQEDEIN